MLNRMLIIVLLASLSQNLMAMKRMCDSAEDNAASDELGYYNQKKQFFSKLNEWLEIPKGERTAEEEKYFKAEDERLHTIDKQLYERDQAYASLANQHNHAVATNGAHVNQALVMYPRSNEAMANLQAVLKKAPSVNLFIKTAQQPLSSKDIFFNAIVTGNNKLVKEYLSLISLNIIVGDFSPLSKAIQKNNRPIVELLIRHGANPNGNGEKFKPLVVAVCEGNLDMVKYLLKSKANPNTPDALFFAIGKTKIYDALIEAGADPLTTFIVEGRIDLVEPLIKAGAAVNKDKHSNRISPLAAAVQVGNYDLVKLLIENGANPNEEGILTKATARRTKENVAIFMFLLKDGRNIKFDPNDSSKIDPYFRESFLVQVKLVHDADANPTSDMIDKYLKSDQTSARQYTINYAVIKKCIEKGVSNIDQDRKAEILCHAIQRLDHEFVIKMFSIGACLKDTTLFQIGAPFQNKHEALYYVIKRNDQNMIRLLIDDGATIDGYSIDIARHLKNGSLFSNLSSYKGMLDESFLFSDLPEEVTLIIFGFVADALFVSDK